MEDLWQGFWEALRLFAQGDATLREVALRTVAISGIATAIAAALGIPAGYALARTRFPGRTFLLSMVNTSMGMPPVVVGLVVWLMLVRSGPFGGWELIYTKRGMVIAQEFVPRADEGDTRVLVVNGAIARVDGVGAAICRVPARDDFRSNIHAGGTAKPVKITERELRRAELIRP